MTRMLNIKVEDFTRTILLLDASLDALDAAAAREKKREAGKRMRDITDQQRAETTRAHVEKMATEYGIEIY